MAPLRSVEQRRASVLRRAPPIASREVGISLPNKQRQHRTMHIQEDGLLYA